MQRSDPHAFPRVTLLLAIVAFAAGGCASNSQEHLTDEAARLVKIGTTVEHARSALATAGFRCGKTYVNIPADLECDRDRSYYILATCIQRVLLTYDPRGTTIVDVKVLRPACTGL